MAGYATDEGIAFGDSIAVTPVLAGTVRQIAVPRLVKTGGWFHVRVQVFPDGRCGVAINSIPVTLSRYRSVPDTAVRLLLSGNSAGTMALVGPTTIRSGVATDIDWSRLDDRIPDKPPAGWSPRAPSMVTQHRP
jgi:hypothetical protein